MIHDLLVLAVLVLIVGVVVYLVTLVIDKVPMDGGWKQILKVLVWLIGALIVLFRLLAMLNVSDVL